MTGPGSCYRQIEFAGIIKGTTQRALAEQFLDFLLGPTFQADIPLQMFVFPVVSNTPLDETFARYLAVPEAPAQVDPARIASQREAWIAAWTEVVLR
jgi:thiamine transport system substrate-binding protein